jgi:hypothetical protein
LKVEKYCNSQYINLWFIPKFPKLETKLNIKKLVFISAVLLIEW